ncbi:asparaginase [Corynebacterium cystitidis]|uniref:asparaginase n=1 Tax=Corynebacterium cystitidis DSM 20524 TaxID=1121357 RepID=A0A1H9NQR5_9CORY|nr:asparaginase [Corynebacterium cystitidis]WJY82766.1 L-asparaginase 1 [Corynebacterium cystitidis DSM 20524]SER38384.1 L-asparaginase [Corynebacterium cystitidis DSM 20524]SNV70793.1 L-asparaginase [Corynebacterium cystitidis]
MHHPATTYVAVIATGGTIASVVDRTGARTPTLTGADLVSRCGSDVATRVFDTASLDSSTMTLADIDTLAINAVRALSDAQCAGVVITHGTDSMADTAIALDLMIDDPRPIVLTGAQESADHPTTDGPANLRGAINLAGSATSGVQVYFNDAVFPARGLIKQHTADHNAFALTAETWLPRPDPVGVVTLDGTRVAVAAAWPGATSEVIEAIVDTRPHGLVVEALGSGNVSEEMGQAIVRALDAGIPVVITTQVPRGPVQFAYGGSGGGSTLGTHGALAAGWLRAGQARMALTVAIAADVDPASLLL